MGAIHADPFKRTQVSVSTCKGSCNLQNVKRSSLPVVKLSCRSTFCDHACCAEYSKTLMREAKLHFESFEEESSASDSAESASLTAAANTASDGSSSSAGNSQVQSQASQQTSTASASTSSSAASASEPPSSSNSSNASPSTSAASNSSASNSSDQQVSSAASTSSLQSECNPQTALAAAHKATRQPGSSTALILQLKDGTNTLKASNLVRSQNKHPACIHASLQQRRHTCTK